MSLDLLELSDGKPKEVHQQVVRLKTTYWKGKRGFYQQKSLTTLSRKSKGFQLLDEEVSNGGAEVIGRIINLDACEDGVYLVTTCNESRDWESGHIDDYDLQLIPYVEQ